MNLSEIQSLITVPKARYNANGKFYYRTCEDILDAAKKVLNPVGLAITLDDEMIEISSKPYIKSTASIVAQDWKVLFSVNASAAEDTYKKGYDNSQKTGSASSYARKRALEGLLALDDVQDADASTNEEKPPLSKEEQRMLLMIEDATDIEQLEKLRKDVKPELMEAFLEKVEKLTPNGNKVIGL